MMKLNLRRLATSSLALGAFAALAASAQTPGITPADSQPAPRRSTPSAGEVAPELDSRAGGELGTGVTTREGLGDAGVTDDASDPEALQRRTFTGLITGVSEDRLTVRMDPPGADAPKEQTFRLGEGATVVVNGEPAQFAAVNKGQVVRLITAPGDPEMAVRLFATTRRVSPRGDDENFDVYPQNDQDTPPRRQEEQPGGRRQAAMGGEEAVLPLGIEVYGGGRQGALVTEMLAGGPAANAGVLINDVIVAVNGQTITDPELIEQQLASNNGAAELTVVRNGETLQLPVEPAPLVEGSLTTARAMRQALITAGFIAGGGLRNGAVVDGVNGGVGTGVGTGGTVVPPADLNGGEPGLTPRSPGRSDAAQGGIGPGRSDAAPSRTGRTRNGTANGTGNNDTGTNQTGNNGTGTNGTGANATGTNGTNGT